MDVIRRDTDYALRLMVNLAKNSSRVAVSSRRLAEEEDVSYQLTSKLLQKLSFGGLVRSKMGPKGGFFIDKNPSKITLGSVVKVIQGPISLNRCLFETGICFRQPNCPIRKKLAELQEDIERFLKNVTLEQILKAQKLEKEKK